MKIFFKCFLFVLSFVYAITNLSDVEIFAYINNNAMDVNAKSAILVDYYTGDVLYSHEADEKLQVASIAKLMTILLTLEEIDAGRMALTDTIIASENSAGMGGSQVFIDANGKYSVEEMLKSVIIASANDASVALAEHISGNESAFVVKMNEKAKELGMDNTVYANSTGLSAPMQYSTAEDTAKILRVVLGNEIYHKYSTVWMDSLTHNSGRVTELVNTNKLIRYYQGCDGGKTGFTDEAGYCLSSSVKRDDMRLVAVVLGTKTKNDRFNESVKLYNYGFANFKNEMLLSMNNPMGKVNVLKTKDSFVEFYPSRDYYALMKKNEDKKFEIVTQLDEKIVAPKTKGDVVGKALIVKEGVVVDEVNLIVNEDIHSLTFKESFNKIIKKF